MERYILYRVLEIANSCVDNTDNYQLMGRFLPFKVESLQPKLWGKARAERGEPVERTDFLERASGICPSPCFCGGADSQSMVCDISKTEDAASRFGSVCGKASR